MVSNKAPLLTQKNKGDQWTTTAHNIDAQKLKDCESIHPPIKDPLEREHLL